MFKRYRFFLLLAILWLTTAALPLEKFIADRTSFSWKVNKKEQNLSYTVYWLDVISQVWEQDHIEEKIWTHALKVTIPNTRKSPVALFLVEGGKTGEKNGDSPEKLLEVVVDTGTILAELKAVPNQPLLFFGEEKPRMEDAIVARTWREHLNNKNSLLPLHFPMVKAVVRGIDALDELLEEQNIALEGVVLVGESKRGWAAWLAAAVDSRVKGIIPIVSDFLNVRATFEHQLQSLGSFSVAIRDYLAEGINDKCFYKQEFTDLMQLVDPLTYCERYTMPKFQINASGDPFSMPDTSRFSFSKLPAPKYLRYLPNTGHSLRTTDYLTSVAAFYRALVLKKALPSFTWERVASGALLIQTQDKPISVKLWKATNPKARDFRWDFTKREWVAIPIAEQRLGIYQIDLPTEEEGWAAYFAELEFDGGLKFTTEVYIVPDRFPNFIPK